MERNVLEINFIFLSLSPLFLPIAGNRHFLIGEAHALVIGEFKGDNGFSKMISAKRIAFLCCT